MSVGVSVHKSDHRRSPSLEGVSQQNGYLRLFVPVEAKHSAVCSVAADTNMEAHKYSNFTW